jgi:hypothetical protein
MRLSLEAGGSSFSTSPSEKNGYSTLGEIIMKKIALITVTVASLALAACGGNDDSANMANAAETNMEATSNEAVSDVNAAAGDVATGTDNSLDAAGNALENGASAVGNAAEAAGNAISNTADAVVVTDEERKK